MSVDLHELFLGLQQQLLTKLDTGRRVIGHPGAKGDASELNWIEMLRSYLPERYAVEKAFVLDCDSHLSQQIDVVVFDRQYCPLLFAQGGAKYVPAESVYAVFEVKQTLDKETVGYAAEKAGSVRRLRRTSVPIVHAGGVSAPRKPFPIIAGLLALESGWRSGLGPSFVKMIRGLPEDSQLDLGCALRHGGFEITYPEAGIPHIAQSTGQTALVFFFLRLLQQLQRRGTVTAMDLSEYGRGLEG